MKYTLGRKKRFVYSNFYLANFLIFVKVLRLLGSLEIPSLKKRKGVPTWMGRIVQGGNIQGSNVILPDSSPPGT
jgi:hypothetical protein